MKKAIQLPMLILLIFSTISHAQPDYRQMTGLIFDKQTEKAATENLPSNYHVGTKADDLPLIYSLKDFASTPRDQFEGTCVGYSVSNALSICLAYRDSIVSQQTKDENVISATFIYNNIKAESHTCLEGARIPDGFELLKEKGSCKAVLFEDTGENCNRLPDDKAVIEDAVANRIKDYISVFDPADEDIMRKVYKTKEQLAIMGVPVVIGMSMPNAFFLKHNFQEPIDLSSDTDTNGGHAMCVVGYDDYMEAFEVMNSWGKGWGNDGFFWLSFEDYARYVKCGFAPILGDKQTLGNSSNDKPTTTLTGEFSFRTPNGFDQHGKPDFKENTPEFNGKNYIINDWKRLKVYQLLGKGMKRNSYTYVFSIDARDKVALHFPESVETLNPADLMTADKVPLKKAIVQDKSETIIIPGEYYALQTVYKGTDNICVIYSDISVSDIQERIEITRKSTAKNIRKRLNEGFGDILIPAKNIDYAEDKMAFTATSGKGSAVPIILQIIVK